MKPELAVVILNYRTPALTIACLGSLANELDPATLVIVVDNASNDGSADVIETAIRIRGWQSWAKVLRSPTNGGFAAGNNLAIRHFYAGAYLLLNSDTLVRPQAIAQLRRALLLRPKVGIVGPALFDESGEDHASYFRQPAPPSELLQSAQSGVIGRLMPRFHSVLPRTRIPIEPDWVAFACVLIRREVIEDVGLLDEGYFMYFEDVDYCRHQHDAAHRNDPGARLSRRGPLRRQRRRRDRLRPAHGLHRQRHLQRHRRAHQQIAIEPRECAAGIEGGGESVRQVRYSCYSS
jgi:GT2 family glycosyltransferase